MASPLYVKYEAKLTNRQEEFLDALVAEMCEQGQVASLNQFGFIDLAHKVEARLRFLADNSDPLKPPSYYKILYSWYISRGDYCSAGDIMYRQAQRFKHVSHKDLSLERSFSLQAQSYVAAINALQLVEKKSAWIIVEGKPPSAPGVKVCSALD
jgi:nuclear pore complex protein Nup160